jgi:DNA-binding NtrC family response regulator
MVVDDTEGMRDLIGTILQRNGYEPLPKANAAQLLPPSPRPARRHPAGPGLPDGDGMELLPQIKKQWPDTEVIVLTGHATFDKAVEATKRGAYHFQSKPFDQRFCCSRWSAPGAPPPEPGSQFAAQGAGHHERRRRPPFSKARP